MNGFIIYSINLSIFTLNRVTIVIMYSISSVFVIETELMCDRS